MKEKEIGFEGVVSDDLVALTLPTVEQFLRGGKEGQSALVLYIFYLVASRKQKTNCIWASAEFCQKGLNWGKTKYEHAKNFLREGDFIAQKVQKGKDGRITKVFTVLKYKLRQSTITPQFQSARNQPGGKVAEEMLTEQKDKCLQKDSGNAYPPIVPPGGGDAPEGNPAPIVPEGRPAGDQTNATIALFKPVNEMVNKLFENKTQRKAVADLLKVIGYEGVKRRIELLVENRGNRYLPVITDPRSMVKKLGALDAFVMKLGDTGMSARAPSMSYGQQMKKTMMDGAEGKENVRAARI